MTEISKKSKRIDSLVGSLDDILREQRISFYLSAMNKAESKSWQRFYWEKMRDEIMGRSPSQVVRMESEGGLCR